VEEFLNRLLAAALRAWDALRDTAEDVAVRLRGWWADRRERRARSAEEKAERASSAGAAVDTRRDLAGDAAVVIATRDDDVASVVGRIDTADTLEVVLVVRRDAKALRRPTAWPHIAAHTRRRGIVLGVVASRGDVRSYARDNGLRAARTPGGLRPDDYVLRVGERDFTVPPVPWGRIIRGSMILVFLGAVLVVGCYQVPSAEIRLIPDSEAFLASGEARPNAIVDVADVDTATIVASTLRRTLVTAVTTTTTGEVEVGDLAATLTLRFANASGEMVQIPQGARVAAEDGVAFRTDEVVDVPADGEVDVTATAEFPGIAGNVASGAVVTPEDLPEVITVTNITPGTGGTNRLVAGVSQEDVDRVRAIADDVLNGIAVATLELAVEEGELGTLIASSVTAAIFSEQPRQLLDEAADVLVVEYTIIAAGLVVSPAQAAEYGELLIRRELPAGQALLPGSVTAEVIPPEERGGQVTVNASGRIAALEEIAAIAEQVVGMSPGDASALLQEQLDLDSAPVIDIRPNFIPWLWLPRRADHIEIVIAGPEVEEAPADETPEGDETPPAESEQPDGLNGDGASGEGGDAVATDGGDEG